jgi:hypothetical protein
MNGYLSSLGYRVRKLFARLQNKAQLVCHHDVMHDVMHALPFCCSDVRTVFFALHAAVQVDERLTFPRKSAQLNLLTPVSTKIRHSVVRKIHC